MRRNRAIVFVDRELRVELLTPAARPLLDLIPTQMAADIEEVLDTSIELEREVETADNHRYLARVMPCRAADDRIAGAVLAFDDITGEEARVQLLHLLVNAQEQERTRLSRELHDQLGQDVTALGLKLSALKATPAIPAEMRDELARLEGIARKLDNDVEFLVWELRPTGLDDLGLADALSDYVAGWSSYFGVKARLRADVQQRVPGQVETVLYRIAQEALNNVVKHSRARHVELDLRRSAGEVTLTVSDDGAGFDPDAVPGGKSLGLVGIRERAALVNGTARIDSRPGEGTRVVVRVPLPGGGNGA